MKKNGFTFISVLLLLVVFLIVPLIAYASGPVVGPFIIADQTVDTVWPAVAYNTQHQEYLVVWQNDWSANDDIYGQRIVGDGRILGPWFSIIAGTGNERTYPDVTYNSQHDEYLVVWLEDGLDIRGQRVSAIGGMVDVAFDLVLGTGGENCSWPAVAYSSTSDRYLLAFICGEYPTTSYDVRARAFQYDGTPDGVYFTVGNFTPAGLITISFDKPIDLAYNRERNEFLVAWDQYFNTLSKWDVNGQRIQMTVGSVGTIGSMISICSHPTNNSFAPAVAAIPHPIGLGQYLVACEHLSGGSDHDILGRRYDGLGNLDPNTLGITNAPRDSYNPAVAGNEISLEYLVTWTEDSPPPFGFTSGICARIIPNQGAFMGDTITFDLGTSSDHSTVERGSAGDFLTVFDNYNAAFGTTRNIWGNLWGNRIYLPLVVQ